MDYEKILNENVLFSAANEEEKKELTACGADNTLRFGAGERIFTLDGKEKAVGIVLEGKVNVNRLGDGTVRLNTLRAGDVFGIAGLFASETEKEIKNGNITEIIAATACRIWFIGGNTVRRMIRENPDFADSYIGYLSRKVRFLNKRIADFTAADAETKTIRYLSELISSDGGARGSSGEEKPGARGSEARSFKINMSTLAKTLDIGRASLYRALASLETKRIIRRTEEQGRIEIIDPAALLKYN